MSKLKELNKRQILLIILAILIIVLIALTIWQWDNIKAISLYLLIDEDDLISKLDDYESQLDDKMNTILEIAEEDYEEQNSYDESKDSAKPNKKATEGKEKKLARINEIIGEIYSLRDSYTAQLSSLQYQAKKQYSSLPKSQKTLATKRSIAFSYVDSGTALERSCDSQIEALLAELKTLLNDIGQDTSVVNEIAYVYAQEKQVKKAQLLAEID